MSLRSTVKSLTNSLEDILSITGVISDGISIAKTYVAEVKEEQILGKDMRMEKFKGELVVDLAEFKAEYKAKMYNLSTEYQLLNTPEINESINAMLEDMGIKE